jgi:hypothetical protein
VLVVATLGLGFFAWRSYSEARSLKEKYSSVLDVEAELKLRRSRFDAELSTARAKLEQARTEVDADVRAKKARMDSDIAAAQSKVEQIKSEQQGFEHEYERRREQLTKDYDTALSKYKQLSQQVSLVEENLEDISFGIYKPHFTFQTSQDYKEALERLRNDERRLIRDGKAAVCAVTWTVSGKARREIERAQEEAEREEERYQKALEKAREEALINNTARGNHPSWAGKVPPQYS